MTHGLEPIRRLNAEADAAHRQSQSLQPTATAEAAVREYRYHSKEHVYVFRYAPISSELVLRSMGRLAQTANVPFTWLDAAFASKDFRQQREQHDHH